MIHPTLTRTFQDKESVNAVLAILHSEDLTPEQNARPQYPFGKIDDIGIGAAVAPLASTSLPRSRSEVAIEDWDVLFNAVTARLRLIVAEQLVTTDEPKPAVGLNRVRGNVLECAAALDQLHATLKEEVLLAPREAPAPPAIE